MSVEKANPFTTVDIEGYAVDIITLIGSYLSEKGITRGNPVDNTGVEYENDVFYISAYDWRDPEQLPEGYQLPNFWWKERNYQVEWYKHIGRGTFANRPITIDEGMEMLERCIASLSGAAVVKALEEPDFWEVEDYEE